MTIDSLKSSIALRLLFCLGIALFSAFVMRALVRFNPFGTTQPEITTQLVTENGFKFETFVNDPEMWLGPKVGFPLDTANLEDQQQQTLTNVVSSENLTMLFAVDRQCNVCFRSVEYIKEVKDQLAQRGIKYCIVSFKTDASEEFFKFANHLNVDSPSFLWAHRNAAVPSPLSLMALPTHLLVDSQHRIRGIWPGGADNKMLRTKMANQIIRDVDLLRSEKKNL